MVIWDHKGEEGSSHATNVGKTNAGWGPADTGGQRALCPPGSAAFPQHSQPIFLANASDVDAVSETGRFRQLRGRRQKKKKREK